MRDGGFIYRLMLVVNVSKLRLSILDVALQVFLVIFKYL